MALTKVQRTPQLITIPTIAGEGGSLGIVEPRGCLPFSPARLYYIYDVPGGYERGAHAHRALEQFMIALGGHFTIQLEGRGNTLEFELSDPRQGLYIPPGYWRNLRDFSSDAVCAVLASMEYEESDYIRNYENFKEWDRADPSAVL